MRRGENRNQIASINDLIKSKEKLYDIITLNLATARNEQKIALTGDFFYLLDAPSGVNMNVRFNEHDADQISLKKGFRFQVPFYQIFLTNTAQAGVVVRIVVGKDLAFDFAELGVVNVEEIVNPVQVKGPANAFFQGSPVTVDTTLNGKLIRALATRYRTSLTLFNEGANPCRVGVAGVTFAGGAGLAGGILLNPGASLVLNANINIYGICDVGLTTKVSFMDEYIA